MKFMHARRMARLTGNEHDVFIRGGEFPGHEEYSNEEEPQILHGVSHKITVGSPVAFEIYLAAATGIGLAGLGLGVKG